MFFRTEKKNVLSEFSNSFGKHLFIPPVSIWATPQARPRARCLGFSCTGACGGLRSTHRGTLWILEGRCFWLKAQFAACLWDANYF